MPLADHADPARLRPAFAEKEIPLDEAVVTVAQGQGAPGLDEPVPPINIAAGFVRNAFHLTVAAEEVISLDEALRLHHRGLAVADADGLPSVFSEAGALAEVVVEDAMPAHVRLAQPNHERRPPVLFAENSAAVDLVLGSVKPDPAVLLLLHGKISVLGEGALGDPAMAGAPFRIDAEFEEVGPASGEVLQPKSAHDEVGSAEPDPRSPSEDGFPRLLRPDLDRGGRSPLAIEKQVRVLPFTCGKDDDVAGFRFTNRFPGRFGIGDFHLGGEPVEAEKGKGGKDQKTPQGSGLDSTPNDTDERDSSACGV